MRRTILFLGLILFFLTSCKEDKTKSISSDKELELDTEVELVGTMDDQGQQKGVSHYDVTREYEADFELFTLTSLEGYLNIEAGFVSFSDIYSFSEHADSLAIPILKAANTDSLQHIVLDTKYRETFFNRTKISPKDSLFIYDYSNNTHLCFPMEKLDIVAILSPYSQIDADYNNQYDYMIGFQIDNDSLKQLAEDYNNTFVSFGSQSPFERGKMQAIVWENIDQKDFPSQKSRLKESHDLEVLNSGFRSEAYSFATNDAKIYLMDYFMAESSSYIQYRLMMIMDSKTGELIREELMSETEASSIATINVNADHKDDWDLSVQYTGKLLKNKPEVLFGFHWASFGCASLDYIPLNYNYIAVNCDNRH